MSEDNNSQKWEIEELREHGSLYGDEEAVEAYIDNIGEEYATLEGFEEDYLGWYESVVEYAEQLLDDMGTFIGGDDFLQRYFNFEAFARDLVLGGDIWVAEVPNGVEVFQNS